MPISAGVKDYLKKLKDHNRKVKDLTIAEIAEAPDGIVIAYNFLRIRRDLKGYKTQEEVAELGNTNISYIGKVETAKVSFGTRAQQKWAKLFHVDRSEFLKRPDIGVRVNGVIMERGAIHPPDAVAQPEFQYVPLPPGYTQDQVAKEKLYALIVQTDSLYPYLKQGWLLYVKPVQVSSIKDGDYIVVAHDYALAAVKEAEFMPTGQLLLKGLGRGDTLTIMPSQDLELERIFHITP